MNGKTKCGGTELYLFSFGVMQFFYGIMQIKIFSSNPMVDWGNRAAQLLGYIILVLIISKRPLKSRWIKYILVAGIILLIGLESTHSTGLIRYFMLILAGRDIPYKKVLRMMLRIYGVVFVFSCILYIMGISNSGTTRRGGIGLGFIHPNTTALVVLTMVLLWVTLQKHYTLKTDLVIIIVALLVWFITKTQALTICLLAYPFLYRFIRKNCGRDNRFAKNLLRLTQITVFGFSVGLVILYPLSIYTPFRTKFDTLFSYRPFLNFNNIMKYGISLWGQNVQIYNTTEYTYNYFGGFLSNQKYNTVDNAYILGLITTGIIPLIIMFICYIAVINKAWKKKNYCIMAAAVIYAVYSFVENGANEGFIMFPYFYLLLEDNTMEGKIQDEKLCLESQRMEMIKAT